MNLISPPELCKSFTPGTRCKVQGLPQAIIPRSTACNTPRAKQPRCVGRDDSYARFVVFAQGRLTHEINRVFALSYMGERCFVVVFAKRSMMSDYPELL